MKQVLRTIITKNGDKELVFSPTGMMLQFSIYKAENPTLGDTEVCERAGLDPQLPMRWRNKYGTHYTEWLDEAIEQSCLDDAKVLYRVGMMQAIQDGNYQFWRDLARTHGVIKDEVRTQTININTDFSMILSAHGGDIERARAELLQKTRGVVEPAGPRVALPADERQQGSGEGAGTGVDRLQGEAVAVANTLGADRRRGK